MPPQTTTAKDMTTMWKGQRATLDATQHVTTSLVIDLPQHLPQPGPEATVPQTASVSANVMATVVKEDAEGGSQFSDGRRYAIELKRVTDDPRFANPWRISKLVATATWVAGNTKILPLKEKEPV
ncbi:hypothetical protein AJ79_06334 [Helicocarpus griseus UAMH5409]|uniref:SnoaL-like domain-containing protein n=1 Tax=Helicocarpus griseus UAMH5409 TaxID=1447875 RepID=A0A2B7XE96_9EURO|nr:hypothetical protein AJ79_06334 [Helicocarpus griseus UAMH5409]